MPRLPILSRELLYTQDRGGYYRILDWNLVNTSLGGMLEPRAYFTSGGTLRDVVDEGINKFTYFDEDRMVSVFGGGGNQMHIDFSH